jgi:flavoprotein
MGIVSSYTIDTLPISYQALTTLKETNHDADDAITASGRTNMQVKWYTMVEDMIAFSKYYTYIQFTVDKVTEDCNHERHYFFNGRHQKAIREVTFSECTL